MVEWREIAEKIEIKGGSSLMLPLMRQKVQDTQDDMYDAMGISPGDPERLKRLKERKEARRIADEEYKQHKQEFLRTAKPCPFCGGEASWIRDHDEYSTESIGCKSCDFFVLEEKTWNERP